MALNNRYQLWVSMAKKTALIIAVMILLAFNICVFIRYAETNEEFVKDYQSPQDALKDYRQPLPAAMYFTGNRKYHNVYPVMMILTDNQRIFQKTASQELKNRLQKYKNTKNGVILAKKDDYSFAKELNDKIFHDYEVILYDKKASVQQLVNEANIFIKNKKMVVWVTVLDTSNSDQGLEAAEQIATSMKMRPYVFNLTADIPQDILQKPSFTKSITLQEQYNSLEQFKKDYGSALQKLIKQVLRGNYKMPEYSADSKHLFDKGNVFVAVKNLDEEQTVYFGDLFAKDAVARSLIDNLKRASLQYLKGKYKVFLVTGATEKQYKKESELSENLIPGQDGIMIMSGYRQAVFLPCMWKIYPQVEEFVKHLKIKAGLNPDYWSEEIKIYHFRAVEIEYEN